MRTAAKTVTEVKSQLVTDQPRKRVGILGGTFNPPHLGHLIMADQVGQQLGLDKVLFMPDAMPPHKNHKKAIDPRRRAEMVAAAIADNPLFQLETIELCRGGKSYSYDTMKQLKAAHPENDYYFIIGGDMVAYLPTWYRIDDLVKLVTFVGVRRKGYPATSSKYPVLWVDAPLIDISSTQIRQMIRQHHSVNYLVPDPVMSYIEEHQLYTDEK